MRAAPSLRPAQSRAVLCAATAMIFALLSMAGPAPAAEPLFHELGSGSASVLQQLSARQIADVESLEQQATTADVHLLRLGSLESLAAGGTFRIPVDDGEVISARILRTDHRAPEDLRWVAETLDGEGQVTLAAEGDEITGVIRLPQAVFRILSLGGGTHAVVRTYPAAFSSCATGAEPLSLESAGLPGRIMGDEDLRNVTSAINFGPPVIKVIVFYTDDADDLPGSITGEINVAETETNTSFANSGIPTRIDVVHTQEVNYAETRNSTTDLARFRLFDGRIDHIHGVRNQYGADVAMLILARLDDACGRAAAIGANAGTAFAVAEAGTGCSVGNFTFGHEIGHLAGARHDVAADSNNSPYAYGHGFLHGQTTWRTIMALDRDRSSLRIGRWSNPSRTFNGAATGTAAREDNARVWRNRDNTLANFRRILIAGPNPVIKGESETWFPYNDGALGGSKTYRWYTSTNGSSWTLRGTSRNFTRTFYSNTYLRLDLGYVGGTEQTGLLIYVKDDPNDPE